MDNPNGRNGIGPRVSAPWWLRSLFLTLFAFSASATLVLLVRAVSSLIPALGHLLALQAWVVAWLVVAACLLRCIAVLTPRKVDSVGVFVGRQVGDKVLAASIAIAYSSWVTFGIKDVKEAQQQMWWMMTLAALTLAWVSFTLLFASMENARMVSIAVAIFYFSEITLGWFRNQDQVIAWFKTSNSLMITYFFVTSFLAGVQIWAIFVTAHAPLLELRLDRH